MISHHKEKIMKSNRFSAKSGKTSVVVLLIFALFLITTPYSFAQQGADGKILILYYSLTGNTKACCEALQQALGADSIEIKDLSDRSGRWGFFKSALGSLLGMHTDIEPENPDLSPYPHIILGSPIWTGKLSMAIRTLIDNNKFNGKKVVIFTTTNAFEKEEYKEKSKNLVREAGGEVVGYYQVLAKEAVNEEEKVDRPKEKIVEDALKLAPEIKKVFPSHK
jgi:flavodoxin